MWLYLSGREETPKRRFGREMERGQGESYSLPRTPWSVLQGLVRKGGSCGCRRSCVQGLLTRANQQDMEERGLSHLSDSDHQFQHVWVLSMFIHQFCDTSWVSCRVAQLWHSLPKESIRSPSWGARSYKTSSKTTHTHLQMPIWSPACHLNFWPIDHRWEVLTTPFLRWSNLLEWFTEFRKTVYLLDHQFVAKGVPTSSSRIPNVHQPGAFQTSSFWIFWRPSYIGMTDEIIGHWQHIQPPAPLPSPGTGKFQPSSNSGNQSSH